MSENNAQMTLSAVLELKDRLTAKIKTANKAMGQTKAAAHGADASIKTMQTSMESAGKSAVTMTRGVDGAKRSLQGLKGDYRATVGINDNATTKVRGIKSNLEGIRGKVYTATVNIRQNGLAKVKSSLSNLAGGALMGTSLQMAGAAGIGFGAYNAIKSYMDFEQEMSKVAALSGATGAEFDALTAKAQQMGATTMFTAKQSADALSYMGMAGWSTQQMLDGIDGVMNLAAASGEDLGRVSDIVTDALTAFGLKAADAGHFSDVLAKASSKSNTNVSMMGMTFKYVAPMAGALKYSVEDVATAIGLMANAGIKGEQAGTSLRAVMTRLVAPPKTAANAMTQLGISVKRADGTMKPWMETMKDLRKAFAGLSEADKTKYASMLAGQEAMSGFLAMVNATDKDFETLTNEIRNADGAAKKMADQRMDNLAGDLTYLSSAWDGMTQKLMKGSGAAGGLRDIVKDLKGLIDTFTKGLDKGLGTAIFDTAIQGVKQLKDAFIQMDGVGSILAGGALALGLAKIVSLVQKARNGLRELAGAKGGLSAGGAGGGASNAMTVNASTVYVNGKTVGGGGGATGNGGGNTTIAGDAAKTGKWSKFGGAARMGGLALAFSALDIMGTRSIAQGRQEEAQERLTNALKEFETIQKDNKADIETRNNALKEMLDAQKYAAQVGALNQTAMAETYGGAAGATIGAAVGSLAGPFGTITGGIIGDILGRKVGTALGGVKNPMEGYNENSNFAKDLNRMLNGEEKPKPVYFADNGKPIPFDITLSNAENVSQQANAETFGLDMNPDLSKRKFDLHVGYDSWNEAAEGIKAKQEEIKNSVDDTNVYMQQAFDTTAQYGDATTQSITADFVQSNEDVRSAWGGIPAYFEFLFGGIKSAAASCASFVASKMADAAASLRAGGHTTLAGAADWVGNNMAWLGGTSYNRHAIGTSWAPGGLTEINEHGGEIVDLPTGSRVYPHATTMKMLNDAITSSDGGNTTTANVTITGNTFTVREEADIDKIAYRLQQLIAGAQANYNPT